jgi:hypothetical protein
MAVVVMALAVGMAPEMVLEMGQAQEMAPEMETVTEAVTEMAMGTVTVMVSGMVFLLGLALAVAGIVQYGGRYLLTHLSGSTLLTSQK